MRRVWPLFLFAAFGVVLALSVVGTSAVGQVATQDRNVAAATPLDLANVEIVRQRQRNERWRRYARKLERRNARLSRELRRLIRAAGHSRHHDAAALTTGAHSGRFLATCYDLTGGTATGVSAGWGVIAVDPSVIPLGSRVWVEGYGNAVAADTGGAIIGQHIDEWHASCGGWPNPTVEVRW
jgi:3D (Asp-Asp-Asp) domain-containing protein